MGITQIKGKVMIFGKMMDVTVTVTSDLAFSDTDEKIIIEAVLEGKEKLHKTNKAQGCPAGSIGYIHNYAENTLYAVSALDSEKRTITITKEGKVNKGKHIFK